MTLDQIVTAVTTKIGQTDLDSQNACAIFANRRYQTIYDTENWVDATVTQQLAIPAGMPIIPRPTNIDRVITIRLWNDETIEPVTIDFNLQTDPNFGTAIGTSGKPKFYTEILDNIRFYPVADVDYTATIFGKLLFVPLASGDTPIIRNIDNCLIAFTEHDMLERLRQSAKAKDKLDEATAALDLMRKIEQQNSNRPRVRKTLTVAGDSLAEMTDAVSARIGDFSQDARILIQEFLRRCYITVYDSQLWQETLVTAKIIRDGPELVMPEYFDRVVSVRANSNLAALMPMDGSIPYSINPQIFEQTGSPVSFTLLSSVGVTTLPPQNEPLSFVSSGFQDRVNVFIYGETGGVEASETIQLNGLTPVNTVHPYDVPITVAKGLTTGLVDVTGLLSGVFLVRLLGYERERKHVRIWLVPTPTDMDGTTCLCLGKKRLKPLITDEDTPTLRGIANILINTVVADMFTKIGNDAGAKAAQDKAGEAMAALLKKETQQAAYAQRVIPYTEPNAYDYGYGCYDGWYSKANP